MQEITKTAHEAREGSSNVGISSLGVITNMVQIGMTSKSANDYIATFKVFAGVILAKLDVS